MSYAAIRDAIAARLSAVPGVGKVSTYERFTAKAMEDPDFVDKFIAAGKINSWWIGRTSRTTTQLPNSDTVRQRRHSITLYAVYSFDGGLPQPDGVTLGDGASGLTFQDLVDAVTEDLVTGDRELGGACFTYQLPNPEHIAIGSYQKASMDVHVAEIPFVVEERI